MTIDEANNLFQAKILIGVSDITKLTHIVKYAGSLRTAVDAIIKENIATEAQIETYLNELYVPSVIGYSNFDSVKDQNLTELIGNLSAADKKKLKDLGISTVNDLQEAIYNKVNSRPNLKFIKRCIEAIKSHEKAPNNTRTSVVLPLNCFSYSILERTKAFMTDYYKIISDNNPKGAQIVDIVQLRYPLDGTKPKENAEIGDKMGLSGERVRQIVVNFIDQVRKIIWLINPTDLMVFPRDDFYNEFPQRDAWVDHRSDDLYEYFGERNTGVTNLMMDIIGLKELTLTPQLTILVPSDSHLRYNKVVKLISAISKTISGEAHPVEKSRLYNLSDNADEIDEALRLMNLFGLAKTTYDGQTDYIELSWSLMMNIGDQVANILYDLRDKNWIHRDDILVEYNKRNRSIGMPDEERTNFNFPARHKHYICADKSGYYQYVADADKAEYIRLKDFIESVLRSEVRLYSFDEIKNKIQEKGYPHSDNTIMAYIIENAYGCNDIPGSYGLKEYVDAGYLSDHDFRVGGNLTIRDRAQDIIEVLKANQNECTLSVIRKATGNNNVGTDIDSMAQCGLITKHPIGKKGYLIKLVSEDYSLLDKGRKPYINKMLEDTIKMLKEHGRLHRGEIVKRLKPQLPPGLYDNNIYKILDEDDLFVRDGDFITLKGNAVSD